MEPIDYRALIQDRRSKDRRPIVRHVICLDPELYAELEEAQQELREQVTATIGDDDEPAADRRMGALPPVKPAVKQAELAVAEVEARIAAVSIVGVFKAFTSTVQAQRHDLLAKAQEDNPDSMNTVVVAAAREDILLTFDHFEGPGRERLELTKEDLETLIGAWSHGEVVGLATRINRASTGANEAPKSVRLSLLNQHSAAT